jgi:hypothetical protein
LGINETRLPIKEHRIPPCWFDQRIILLKTWRDLSAKGKNQVSAPVKWAGSCCKIMIWQTVNLSTFFKYAFAMKNGIMGGLGQILFGRLPDENFMGILENIVVFVITTA